MKKNKIKGMAFLLSLLFVGACATDYELTDDGRTVTMTAVMPVDGNPAQAGTTFRNGSANGSPARVGLTPKAGSLDLLARWQTDDEIQIFLKQGAVAASPQTVKVRNISSDGKSCAFDYILPEKFNKDEPYDVLGLCGIKGEWVKSKVSISTQAVRKPLAAFKAPVYFHTKGGPQSQTASFRHLGTYEVLHFRNTSGKSVSFLHKGYAATEKWYHEKFSCTPEDSRVTSGGAAAANSEAVTVGDGETALILSWYLPTGKKITGASLLAGIDGREVKSQNTKTSAVAIETGKAYHLYAAWNGKALTMGKEEINEEKLALVPNNLQMKAGETSWVDIVGGKGSYTVSVQDPAIANAAVSNGRLKVSALSAGNTIITVQDNQTHEKAQLGVTVSASGDLALSEDNITVRFGEIKKITIKSGSGVYNAYSTNEKIAKVSLEGNIVTVTPVAVGNAFVVVQDVNTGKEKEVRVSVLLQTDIEYVTIPAGKGVFYTWDGHRYEQEMKSFKMSKYEITFEQYDAYCEATGKEKPSDNGWGRGKRPVINLSYFDVDGFARYVGARLPSVEEWEYACRAGSDTEFYTGDCLSTDDANYDGTKPLEGCPKGVNREQTKLVGTFSPNPWGLYDMHGNVTEWTQTGHGYDMAGNSAYWVKGGSYSSNARDCKTNYRTSHTIASGYAAEPRYFGDVGIRLVVDE